MIESKPWNWELVDKNDAFWNNAAPEMYFLAEDWAKKCFKNILDVGCGYGRNSVFLAAKGFNMSGFDLSQRSVETTKENGKKYGFNFDNFVVADMLKFPYEDNQFDALIAMNVISHTDKEGFNQILHEIKRVLKLGGEAYFTLGSKESFWFTNPECIYVDENTRIRVEDGPENGIPHFYIDDDDCKTLFKEFKIIKIKEVRELTEYGTFSPHYHIWIAR